MLSIAIPAQMHKHIGNWFNQIFAIIKRNERRRKKKEKANKYKLAQFNLKDKNKNDRNLESSLNNCCETNVFPK